VRTLPEVAEVQLGPIVTPQLSPAIARFIDSYNQQRTMDPGSYKVAHGQTALSTYLFVNIEPGRFNDVFAKLTFMRGVVSCDATEGEYDAVVLLQTPSFEETKRVLSKELSRIDGIARTRSTKIINMLKM
jgi:DNA-binding Lrp family transcriptional regulator